MKLLASLLTLVPTGLFAQNIERPPMEFRSIDNRTTLIVAYAEIGGTWIEANYLVLEGDSISILLDTPWNDEQTRELLAWSDTALTTPISHAIITHSHDDRMGGIAALHERGIETYIHPLAQEMREPFEAAKHLIETERDFDLGRISIRVIYPGDGHAPGNLIVQIGRHGLYGGCFLKSANSRTLGNLADADIKAWKPALESIEEIADRAVWVIPGHGSMEDGAYERTVELVNQSLDELEK